MVLSRNCSHKHYCEHPVHPCRNCGSTVIQCKAKQHRQQGWCCEACDHVKPKVDEQAAAA